MNIKDTFDNEASEYDFTSRAVNLYFDEPLDYLVDCIKTNKKNPKILDICCGTGILTEKVAKKYPRAEFTGVDFSVGMVEIAKMRMKDYNFNYQISDICDEMGMKKLGMFDIVISSLGVHNIHGKVDKENALKNIIKHLKTGGQYITFDYIKGKNKKEKEHFYEVQKQKLLQTYNEEETTNWLNLLLEEDDPETLNDNLKLLENAGLTDCQVLWQKEFLAVWQGTKK